MTLPRRDGRVLLALLGFGVTAGSAFMFVKLLVGEITPLQLVTGRVVLGALPLLATMLLGRSTPRLSPAFLAGVTVLAVADTIAPYLLIAWAAQHVASSTSALLISTMPLFTVLIAAQTSEAEPLTPAAAVGLASGFLGVAVLAGPGAYDVGSSGAQGVLAVILAALCYAAAAVYSRRLSRVAAPIPLSAVKLTIAACILLPATAATESLNSYASLSGGGWLALTAVGFVSTGVGRSVYQWVIATAGSVRASLVTYVVPLVALFLGWAVLGERIGPETLAGAALIIAGIASVMYGRQLAAALRSLLAVVAARPVRQPVVVRLPDRADT